MSSIDPTPTPSEQLSEIMDRVKTWPRTLKIALAKRVLDALDVPEPGPATRGRPVEELIGLGAGSSTSEQSVPPRALRGRSVAEIIDTYKTDQPAPDDETIRLWIDEHRMEKYG